MSLYRLYVKANAQTSVYKSAPENPISHCSIVADREIQPAAIAIHRVELPGSGLIANEHYLSIDSGEDSIGAFRGYK